MARTITYRIPKNEEGDYTNRDEITKFIMNECTACGGNWGAMLLSGFRNTPHAEMVDFLWDILWEDYKEFHCSGAMCVSWLQACISAHLHGIKNPITTAWNEVVRPSIEVWTEIYWNDTTHGEAKELIAAKKEAIPTR